MSGFFKCCPKCDLKVSLTDGNALCLYCLGEGHNVETSKHCSQFSCQTKKNRAAHLCLALILASLRALMEAKSVSVTSASTQGLSASISSQSTSQGTSLTVSSKTVTQSSSKRTKSGLSTSTSAGAHLKSKAHKKASKVDKKSKGGLKLTSMESTLQPAPPVQLEKPPCEHSPHLIALAIAPLLDLILDRSVPLLGQRHLSTRLHLQNRLHWNRCRKSRHRKTLTRSHYHPPGNCVTQSHHRRSRLTMACLSRC